ncbi:Zinc finger protein 568 [Nymphon striatum]|nr:Zinc finger protein 568 [Nymphon striatum]
MASKNALSPVEENDDARNRMTLNGSCIQNSEDNSLSSLGEKGVLKTSGRHKFGVGKALNEVKEKYKQFVCRVCNKAFKLKSSLSRHLKHCHDMGIEDPVACSECGEKFNSKSFLAKHILTHNGGRPYSCDVCSKTFSRKYHLIRHMRMTSCSGKPLLSHKCEICGRVYTRKDNLRDHLRVHSGEITKKKKTAKCDDCGKDFRGASLLAVHKRVHTGEKPFKCTYCDKRFPSSGSLKKHIRTHTGEKPYKCEECGDEFSLKGTLNRHVRIHSGIRPHKCSFCEKEFIQAGGLRAHMFYHTGENGFQCQQCSRKFNRKARLNMHIKYVHKKEKPFGCSQCDKKFTRKEDLTRHEILHSGKKPFKCPTCFKTFAIKPSLKLHLVTHTKEEPCACHECGRAFIRKDCLLRHMRRRHRRVLDKIYPAADCGISNTGRNIESLLQAASLSPAEEESNILDAPYIRKLSESELCDHIKQLLSLLVDDQTLTEFGWPNKPVDELLEAVIERCGHTPVNPDDYTYIDRLKENSKLLFTVVIDDSAVKTLLNNQTVEEIIQHVLYASKSTSVNAANTG